MPNSEGDLSLLKPWTSEQITIALISENQDVILDNLDKRFNFEKNLTWSMLKSLGVAIWLQKYPSKIQALIEQTAKNEYKFATGDGGQSKAEHCALFYVLTGKIAIL